MQSDTAQAITGRPCSRSLTCIILSPITLGGLRTYKPLRRRAEFLPADTLYEGPFIHGEWRW
jgi:hypothetical protein